MKKIYLVAALALLFLVSIPNASASTWTPITVDSTGNTGGRSEIHAFSSTGLGIIYNDITNGDTKFAKSTTSGSSWTTYTIDASSGGAWETSWHPVSESLFIAAYGDDSTQEVKFSKSVDGGETWTAPVTASSCGANICRSSPNIISTDTSTFYITFSDSTDADLELAKSTDAGATWVQSTIESVGAFCPSDTKLLVFASNNIHFPAMISTDAFCNFGTVTDYRTTNGGTSWTATGIQGISDNQIYIGQGSTRGGYGGFPVYRNPGVGPDNYVLYETTNDGTTWDAVPFNINDNIVASPPFVSSTLSPFTEGGPDILFGECVGACGGSYIMQSAGPPSASNDVSGEGVSEINGISGSHLAILSADVACTSGQGGSSDLKVYCTSNLGGAVSTTGPIGNGPISQAVQFFNLNWGFDGSWLFGIAIVAICIWPFAKKGSNTLVIAIMALLGVGLAFVMGLFPVWLIFVLIFLIIAVGSHRMLQDKGGEES